MAIVNGRDNRPRPGDTDNQLLQKILNAVTGGGGLAENVSIIDVHTGDPVAVTNTSPSGSAEGLVVRNIPSGTQAVSIGDGADVAEGSRADAAQTDQTQSGTVISWLKGIIFLLKGTLTVSGTVTAVSSPAVGALTNRSGTMTAGGTSQQVMGANATRKYLLFQNVSSENMWINFGVAAVANQPSILIVPQGSLIMESSFVSNEALNVISATTGSAYTAKEA